MPFSFRHPTYRDLDAQLEGFDPSIRCETALGLPISVLDRMDKRLLIQIDDRRYAEGLVEFKSMRPRRRGTIDYQRSREIRCATERSQEASQNDSWRRGTDALASIPAKTYLEVLAPDSEPHRGKCRCPLPDHEDARPSASYKDTAWYCHRCGEGGGIFQVASAVTGLDDRGPQFIELRRWTAERLLGA